MCYGYTRVRTHDDNQKALEEPEQVATGDDEHQISYGHREADYHEECHEPADQCPTAGLLSSLDPVQCVLWEVLEQVHDDHQGTETCQWQKAVDQRIVFQVSSHEHGLDPQVVVA